DPQNPSRTAVLAPAPTCPPLIGYVLMPMSGRGERMAGHIDAGPATTRPCHHQEMTDYRDAVRPATEAIDVLSSEIEADLDEMAGGISWWNGHVGWKVSAQLGEYLLASCTGVGTSLRNASLAV